MKAGPYSIGSDHCPGLSKLAEEAGEVGQVVGKIIGAGGLGIHFDGSDLRVRLTEEVADVVAAAEFVIEANGLDREAFRARVEAKLARFRGWHTDQGKPRADGCTCPLGTHELVEDGRWMAPVGPYPVQTVFHRWAEGQPWHLSTCPVVAELEERRKKALEDPC